MHGFPLKLQIPINFAINAVVNFMNFKALDKKEDYSHVFEIPKYLIINFRFNCF